MNASGQNAKETMTDDLKKVFKETVLAAIHNEVKASLILIQEIKHLGSKAFQKCREAIDDQKQSVYLDENAKYSLAIRLLVKERFDKNPQTDFYPIVSDCLLKSYQVIQDHCNNQDNRAKVEQLINSEWFDSKYVSFIRSTFSSTKNALSFRKKIGPRTS